jgi:hypothetical protein
VRFRCWKDRKPYDEGAYLAALRRRGSPVIEKMDSRHNSDVHTTFAEKGRDFVRAKLLADLH